jgi:hypothetical protein
MSASACVANIGPRQRRQRRLFGWVAFAAAAVILGGLLASGVPRVVRLLAAVPFWAGVLGFLQHKEST